MHSIESFLRNIQEDLNNIAEGGFQNRNAQDLKVLAFQIGEARADIKRAEERYMILSNKYSDVVIKYSDTVNTLLELREEMAERAAGVKD